MEKHTNKKVFAGLLAVSCAFVLGGCDPIESLPANYNDPILEYLLDESSVDTKDNIMGEIYNKISGDKDNKVLQIVLDELAERKFGTYTKIQEAYNNATEKSDYIANHEFFNAEGDKDQRFKDFYDDVMERVSEAFYNLIVSGSYNDTNSGMFSEKKLYTELKKDFWDLKEVDVDSYGFKEFYVTKELTKENAKDFLNMELYTNSDSSKRGYIEKKVFPQILKDKLVEQYVFDENYDSLGRSYARNINLVKVSYDDKSRSYTAELMKKFTSRDEFMYTPNTDYPEVIDYTMLQEAINGFDKVNNNFRGAAALINIAGQDANGYSYTKNDEAFAFNADYKQNKEIIKSDDVVVTINSENEEYYTTIDGTQIFNFVTGTPVTYKFFGFTKLGQLMDSYNKAIEADKAGEILADSDDAEELAKFTSGKSLADSLRDKVLALDKEDSVTNGWFVKNGGVADLPAALKDRLFSINVANNLDEEYDGAKNKGYYSEDSKSKLGNYRFVNGDPTKAKLTRTPYIRNIFDRKFVMSANPTDFDIDNANFVYNDGSAFYICQVLEAPNAPKLKQDVTSVYTEVVKEQIARSIAKVLSTKDSFVTDAYTKYLEEYKFTFNETSLYDYFKGQYPDLFEDED